MVKYSYTVKVYFDATNYKEFADSDSSTAGTVVVNQLEGKGDIRVTSAGHEYFIPKHSITYADVTKTSTTVPLVDANCESEESE